MNVTTAVIAKNLYEAIKDLEHILRNMENGTVQIKDNLGYTATSELYNRELRECLVKVHDRLVAELERL